MRRLWLLFTQTTTLCLALVFALSLWKPEWLPWNATRVVAVRQAPPQPVAAGTPPAPGGSLPSFRDAARRAMPAVVNVYTSKQVNDRSGFDDPILRRFFGDGQPRQQTSLGSGVVVSQDGFILTNHHVIEGAQEINVAFTDGHSLAAKLVGADPESDLAVLRVDVDHLTSITFGNSEQLQIGDIVLAIGNPFGVGQTVTMGIVSALGRSKLGINTFESFIQTDAAINPGNSGGALVDVAGNLVGINSAIYSKSGGSQGIGFTIPVSIAKHVMEDIIKTGSVTRGWIGVEVQDVTADLAESFRLKDTGGALIAGVMRGGPAEKAGMRPGDVMLEIEGKHVTDASGMLNIVADLKPGTTAHVKVLRSDAATDLAIVIGKRPTQRRSAE
jgi:serine protease DegQ